MNGVLIVLPILTLLMFELGLTLRLDDFKLFKERPRPILGGLLGQLILLPILAYALGKVFGLDPIFFIGIMLIACCPGGSSSNVFSLLAGGDVALSVSLTACSSILTLFTLPVIMNFVTNDVGSEVNIHLPIGKLLVQNILLMFVPILVGIFVRNKFEHVAQKLDAVLRRLAFPALILLATIFFIQHKETIIAEFGQLGLCISCLILLAMTGGMLTSKLFRLTGKEERTLIIEIGMQNAAQSIAIASSPFVFNNSVIAIPAIIYALMMNVILLIYVGIFRFRHL